MVAVGDIVICAYCNKPFVIKDRYHKSQKYHLECGFKKSKEDRKEYYRLYEQTGEGVGRPKK
jgi:hypothetical protein